LHKQEEKSEQKEKLANEKKLKSSMLDFMNVSYLHQQFNSPCCSMTAGQVFQEFDKLKSNNADGRRHIILGQKVDTYIRPLNY
jgi:hypothetical protein